MGAELSGYARFGQVYAFEARPRALRLRYKATVNPIGEEGQIRRITPPKEIQFNIIGIFLSIIFN